MDSSAQRNWLERLKADYFVAKERVALADSNGQLTPTDEVRNLMLGAIAVNDRATIKSLHKVLWPKNKVKFPMAVGPSAKLLEWCATNGADCIEVLKPAQISLQATTAHSRAFDYLAGAAYRTVLSDAAWVPGWDFIVAADGTVLTDSGYLGIDLVIRTSWLHVVAERGIAYHRPAKEIRIPEAVYISAPNNNVGHWFIDFLPRLMARAFAPPHTPVVVPADMPAKQIETLMLFGVPEQEIVVCRPGVTMRFDRLHVYKPGQSMPPRPEHVRFVHGGLSKAALAPRKGKRIYAARTSVGTRAIVNAGEFQQFLDREGFITVDPADLSMAEQQALFSDAETILGAFGSNMLSLYLAPKGCKLIVLMSDIDNDPCLAPTAAILGMRHQFVVCKSAPNPATRRHKKDMDLVVDCEELRDRLAL